MKNEQHPNVDVENVIAPEVIEDIDMLLMPEYFIHLTLKTLHRVLLNPDFNIAIQQYYFLVRHLEALCRASNLLPKDYDDKVKEYMQKNEYKNEKRENIKMYYLSVYKLQLILKELSKSKVLELTPEF